MNRQILDTLLGERQIDRKTDSIDGGFVGCFSKPLSLSFRQIDRLIVVQIDRQICRQIDRQLDRQIDRQVDIDIQMSTWRLCRVFFITLITFLQVDRQIDRQADRKIERQIDLQLDRQICSQIDRQIGRYRQIDIYLEVLQGVLQILHHSPLPVLRPHRSLEKQKIQRKIYKL